MYWLDEGRNKGTDFKKLEIDSRLILHLPSSAKVKNAYGTFAHPKKAGRTRLWHAARKGVRDFGFRLAMDPREAGKLGGRPSKAAAARSAAARAVASGSQRTLNFSGNLTLSGTFKGTVNINIGGAGGAGADAGAADGQDEPADAADGAAA